MAEASSNRSRAKKPARKAPAPPTPWRSTPALEWIASGLGLLLTLGAIGFILWEAVQPSTPPVLSVRTIGQQRSADGWTVEVEVHNAGRATAAAVEVEGVLSAGGRELETSSVVFDYLPGDGRRRGGLVFENDPTTHELKLQPRGYVRP